jgi:arginine utilization protein RocB
LKLTVKPLSFGYSVVDSHSSVLCFNLPYEAKTPPSLTRGFLEMLKLTVKPLSFGYSVVDSHSSVLCFNLPYEAKTPAIAGRGFC